MKKQIQDVACFMFWIINKHMSCHVI